MTPTDPQPRVLVIDDDNSYRSALEATLASQGFVVELARGGRDALRRFHKRVPDVVLLELRLPDISGIEVCRIIRSSSDAAILVLSATNDENDVVRCFEVGADDYLCKPFRTLELIARVNAARRYRNLRPDRSGVEGSADSGVAVIEVGPYRIDYDAHTVEVRGRRVDLTPKEFELLYRLARHPGQVCSREELMSDVWAADENADDRTLDVHISRLRSKLEAAPRTPHWILTAQGVGYLVNDGRRKLAPPGP